MAWFRKLSPDGARWVGEQGGKIVTSDGQNYGPGIQPVWLTADKIGWLSPTGPVIHTSANTDIPLPRPANRLEANARGDWVAWHPGWGYTTRRGSAASPVRPTVRDDGSLFFPPEGCIEPISRGLGDVAIRHPGPHIDPLSWAPWDPVTHYAVPVEWYGAPWIVRQEGNRLVFHPRGTFRGHVLYEGELLSADFDARFHGTWLRVVAADFDRAFDLSAAIPIDLRPPVGPPPLPDPEPPPMRENINPATFSWGNVEVCHGDANPKDWPMTSTPTDVEARESGQVFFRHTEAGGWPTVATGTWGNIEGSIWYFVQINGCIYAATFDQLRPGQESKDMAPDEYGDGYVTGQGPAANPLPYQVVGYMVSTPARSGETGPINERSPVVFIKFGTNQEVGREGAAPPPPTPEPPPTPDPGDLALRVAVLEMQLDHLTAWARGVNYDG